MDTEEEKRKFFSEVSDIKLIDFLNEDDVLVDHRFRDCLEDLRLSGFIHESLHNHNVYMFLHNFACTHFMLLVLCD